MRVKIDYGFDNNFVITTTIITNRSQEQTYQLLTTE